MPGDDYFANAREMRRLLRGALSSGYAWRRKYRRGENKHPAKASVANVP